MEKKTSASFDRSLERPGCQQGAEKGTAKSGADEPVQCDRATSGWCDIDNHDAHDAQEEACKASEACEKTAEEEDGHRGCWGDGEFRRNVSKGISERKERKGNVVDNVGSERDEEHGFAAPSGKARTVEEHADARDDKAKHGGDGDDDADTAFDTRDCTRPVAIAREGRMRLGRQQIGMDAVDVGASVAAKSIEVGGHGSVVGCAPE